MYKKMIAITGIAMLAAGVFFATNTNAAEDNNSDLASLLRINVANAECGSIGGIADGHCLSAEICVYGGSDCTFGW